MGYAHKQINPKYSKFCLAKNRIITYKHPNPTDIDRIIEMAWEDRTPFEAIKYQFNLNENDVIRIMRSNLKSSSFKLWRKRVSGRKTKHGFTDQIKRFRSPNQK